MNDDCIHLINNNKLLLTPTKKKTKLSFQVSNTKSEFSPFYKSPISNEIACSKENCNCKLLNLLSNKNSKKNDRKMLESMDYNYIINSTNCPGTESTKAEYFEMFFQQDKNYFKMLDQRESLFDHFSSTKIINYKNGTPNSTKSIANLIGNTPEENMNSEYFFIKERKGEFCSRVSNSSTKAFSFCDNLSFQASLNNDIFSTNKKGVIWLRENNDLKNKDLKKDNLIGKYSILENLQENCIEMFFNSHISNEKDMIVSFGSTFSKGGNCGVSNRLLNIKRKKFKVLTANK